MDLMLTVVTPANRSSADVHISAIDTSPAATVLSALRQLVGADPDCPMTIDGRLAVSDGTVADVGLVAGMTVVAGEPIESRPEAGIELAVTSGPDAGRRFAVTDGDHLVGRDPDCDLQIADAGISRRHLRINVAADSVILTDLGSANGALLDGRPVAACVPVELLAGTTIRIGDSDVAVQARPLRLDSNERSEDRVVHRAPRLITPAAIIEVAFPGLPAPPTPVRVPILAAIAPLIAGLVLALVLHQWQFLAFTALSPIMILGQAASDRWSSRRITRAAGRDHVAATAAAQAELDRAIEAEHHRRHEAAPDLAQLSIAASRRSGPLWQRSMDDPDALVVRLGRGDLTGEIRVVGGPGVSTVSDVPVSVSLPEAGVIGVCGPRDLATGLVRSLIIQAATLHSPADVRLVVLAPGRTHDWTWARWLPHIAAHVAAPVAALVGFDDDQASSRVNELLTRDIPQVGREPHTVVVIDSTASLRASAAVAALLARHDRTISIIWCCGDRRDLPGECSAVVHLSADPRLELRLTRAGNVVDARATPDLLAADVAEAIARELAPLRSGASSTAHSLPNTVRWSDVSDVDLSDRGRALRSLARQWSLVPSTEIALGRGVDGLLGIDLCRDGPHALIAGTTGSGKSELLLSLVASLAARNRPDQLSLLLIDHKGGAAFGQCARLPHTVGLVTDLDAASTQRALLSLSAEIRRREALFAAVGASDLEAYAAAVRGSSYRADPLARLVIVVDEFAALAEEQPEFVGGLVGIAQRGRSLGVHLILATQRPDGVVSADIRANTRLRICLSVARDNESRDVIDCADAVSISRTTPGRAYLRVGPGELREFQSARIGGARPIAGAATVSLAPTATLGEPTPTSATESVGSEPDDNDSDLNLLIDAAIELTAAMRCVTPPPPWLPPLPDLLPTSTMPTVAEPHLAAWGLIDLPAAGRQGPLPLDLGAGGTTLIAGAARSGRTSAAMTIAVTAAERLPPEQLQLWAIDAGAGLSPLSELPHCGAVVPAHDIERVERLLSHLSREIQWRRQHPNDEAPTLMLVLDSWDGLIAASDVRDSSRLIDTLLRLAVDGPSAGLHAVITSDRSGLVGRLGATAAEKIVLRLADPSDFALVGMSARDVPRRLPPGRGVRAIDLALVQIAQVDQPTMTAARAWPPPQQSARRFDPLPQRVTVAELATTGRRPDGVTLGLSADELHPVTVSRLDLGSTVVIAGPPGSGRSSAMLLLASQLTGRPLAVSCSRRSPLADHRDAVQLPRDDQHHAAAILDSLSSNDSALPDVMIDDIDLLAEGPLWARLEDLLRGGHDNHADSGRVIAIAAAPEAIAAAFRGPMTQARRAKVGLLLCPANPHDGELFDITLPRRSRGGDPPGRGWLALRGQATALQLADPTPVSAVDSARGGRSDRGHLVRPHLLR
jgi:S-DNA-T family DNA segregation ATPase FtsK/SpoIIIE